MLETYFVKPQTVDGVRAVWIGPEIEHYVAWLAERGYSVRSVLRRVPLLVAFGEFARLQGARSVVDLPGHVNAFVDKRVSESCDARRGMGQTFAKDIRGPVEQLLELVVAGFEATGRPHHAVPTRCPGSSSTSHQSVAFGLSRSCRTGITLTDSRLTCNESASPGCTSCRRRC